MALSEAIYLKNLLFELVGKSGSIILYNDNVSAQKLAVNPVFHKRSKHIIIRHHFVRDAVNDGHIVLRYLCTNKMCADILTKSLNSTKHSYFMRNLGLNLND